MMQKELQLLRFRPAMDALALQPIHCCDRIADIAETGLCFFKGRDQIIHAATINRAENFQGVAQVFAVEPKAAR